MELWDVYNQKKERTGRTMVRNDWNMQPGEYHLSVLGVLRRSDGKFLITKRAGTKEWAPGWWEVSGGAALAGEDSKDAVLREIKEETGLDVSGWDGGFLFDYRRDNPKEKDNYFVDVYRFEGEFGDADIHLQESETEAYMFATLEQIQAFAGQGVFLHYHSIQKAFGKESCADCAT
ncbi:MAG: NUDIX domain-containing protein [Clostridiaceae bacterium]|nr:NUDIX domain-containing protein [Clostridiaceae bacterium]